MKIKGIKMTLDDIGESISRICSGILILIIFITNLMVFAVLYKFHPFILKSQDISILLMFGCALTCLMAGYGYFKNFEQ